ncbi:hypothetical protein [Chondromyces apiculatus]|uniref:Uncharacterized protein n=1 Tax=Chondromyces apiculatus DSM 436 TaxID=1192034 RepID=A0A017SY57_9BACT|nr:hypothetical protein [Chondromyces apiculatus]EYF01898.1 Hypothetical protein CAP_7666 [Chondromyces apiculatus DSM 436]
MGAALARAPGTDQAIEKLKAKLKAEDPSDARAVLSKELPALAANFGVSAADNTELGKLVTEVARVRPSTIATLVSVVVALFAPKRMRGLRRGAARVGKGCAHAVLARLGQQAPGALRGATETTLAGAEGPPAVADGAADGGEAEHWGDEGDLGDQGFRPAA